MTHSVKPSEDPLEYDWYKDDYYNRLHRRLRLIGHCVNLINGRSVLDIGCGDAGLEKLLNIESVDYRGCDAYSASKLKKENVVEWKFEKDIPLPFSDVASFDVAVCSGLFEYIEEQDVLFNLISDKLSSSGKLVCTLMNPSRTALMFRKKFGFGGFWHPAWVNIPRWNDFADCAGKAGLVLEGFVPVYRGVLDWRSDESVVKANYGVPVKKDLNSYLMHEGIFIFGKSR